MVKVKYGDGEVQKRLRILTNAGARQTLTGGGIGWLLPGLLARLPACLLADSATLSFFFSFFFLCLGACLFLGVFLAKGRKGRKMIFASYLWSPWSLVRPSRWWCWRDLEGVGEGGKKGDAVTEKGRLGILNWSGSRGQGVFLKSRSNQSQCACQICSVHNTPVKPTRNWGKGTVPAGKKIMHPCRCNNSEQQHTSGRPTGGVETNSMGHTQYVQDPVGTCCQGPHLPVQSSCCARAPV